MSSYEHEIAAAAAGEQAMSERMVRMETKIDMLLQRIDSTLLDHETRLRKIERTVWVASGLALAGGGTVGAVAGHFLGA